MLLFGLARQNNRVYYVLLADQITVSMVNRKYIIA